MSADGPILERVRAEGRLADLGPAAPPEPATPVARAAACLVEAAERRDDDPGIAELWHEAGGIAGFEELDELLQAALPGGFFRGFSGRRRRLRSQARRLVAESSSVRAVSLAVAFLGASGDRTDAPVLEDLAVHPALCEVSGAALTFLADRARGALESLLRLLHRSASRERVIVIRGLLHFAHLPIVRLALIRDALHGMEPEHAREVADDIYHVCNVEQGLEDPQATEALREGARLVLAHRTGA